MHTDVIRNSPRVAPNFCGYCACRKLLYVITSFRFPLQVDPVSAVNKFQDPPWLHETVFNTERYIYSVIFNVHIYGEVWYITYSTTLPTLNKVVIMCNVHYIVHLQCTFSLSRTYESKGFWHPQEMMEQWRNTVPVQYSIMCSLEGWRNNKNHAFPSKRCISNEKESLTIAHFTMKTTRTYRYITCSKKILFVKNILAYCGYSPTSPFFLLHSEHKYCGNAATNSKSENARSRMVASLWRSVGTATKEDESSIGRIWAAAFHRVMACSCLARVLKLMNRLFLQFSNFLGG